MRPTLSWARCMSGDCVIMVSLLGGDLCCCSPLGAFGGMRQRCLAHPRTSLVSFGVHRHALAIAWPVAGEHALELGPVDLAVAPMAARLVERELGVRERQAQIAALRNRGIDELLAQIVVGEALDLPLHGVG